MHFRQRGPSIQLVRSTYDEESKRTKHNVLGRFSRTTLRVPEEVLGKLSAEEKTELVSFIERAKAMDLLRRRLTAHSLLETIAEAIDYANELEDEAERDQLRAYFAEAIVALRQAARSKSTQEAA